MYFLSDQQVVRRKWWHTVARRDEIRRLLALASNEAAKAEFEAAAVYSYACSYGSPVMAEPVEETMISVSGSSPVRQSQYQCEVCFSPTTTRCKQCRVVHYWYNDGDPLDQSYMVDNVLNYHSDENAKIGAGLDYVMLYDHLFRWNLSRPADRTMVQILDDSPDLVIKPTTLFQYRFFVHYESLLELKTRYQNMGEDYKLIPAITPSTTNWIAKVVVALSGSTAPAIKCEEEVQQQHELT
ncbi:Ubiquitin carboxyl-terminal hydrolase [Abeliophyllum distichum]|uniref:Ubiquitin carboxyl-terminal hydrolase n=1 Tax=Abeliophyllum distichum TaxID=126358 RepID=A0ABD1V411_9LAMI